MMARAFCKQIINTIILNISGTEFCHGSLEALVNQRNLENDKALVPQTVDTSPCLMYTIHETITG